MTANTSSNLYCNLQGGGICTTATFRIFTAGLRNGERGEGGPGHKKGEKRSDHTEFLNDPLLVVWKKSLAGH